MKTFMNITNYRSKSSNPLGIIAGTGATMASANIVSTSGYNQ